MKFLENADENFTMAYAIHGTGKPVILLHGYGLNHTLWSDVVKWGKEKMRFILPDLRGHGESDVPPGVYSMELMADDVLNLMNALGIEKVTLAGHSMGGYIALAFAKKYPGRLNALCLVATKSRPDSPQKSASRKKEMQLVKEKGSIVVADSLAPRLSKNPLLVKSMHTMISKTKPQGIIGAGLGMADRPESNSTLAGFQKPVLVIAGKEDMITPLSGSQEMAEIAQYGRLVVLSQSGHLPMLEQPREVAEAIINIDPPYSPASGD